MQRHKRKSMRIKKTKENKNKTKNPQTKNLPKKPHKTLSHQQNCSPHSQTKKKMEGGKKPQHTVEKIYLSHTLKKKSP